MNAARWQDIFAIFEEAVALPVDQRREYLDQTCGEVEVRRAVEDMLEVDRQENTLIIDQPLDRGSWATQTVADRDVRLAPSANTIGAYRLLRRVGQGGMSTVYLAVRADDAFRRHVVVKLVRRGMESEEILRRLRTERQILASLDHPFIARLFDGGSTEEGLPYFVMEHVDGVPIDAYCEHNLLSVDERLTLFRKVCAAVRYAHQNLVVHRDIKPSNILVTAEGDPKLLDFGIAKLLNPDLASAETEPTATWQRVMTPSYASPEQIRGKQITTASDIYSLGVLLYKLLSGRLPRTFKGRSPGEIEGLLSASEPLPPSTAVVRTPAVDPDATEEGDRRNPAEQGVERMKRRARQLTGDLDAIVLKALRSAPPQRYGSVERFAEDIERFQGGLPVKARAGTWRYRAGKFVRRHRTAMGIAAAVVVLVVGFAVATAWQNVRFVRERNQALFERDQKQLERDKKQQVLALMLDIFQLSSPYVLPGEELTVREALRRSVSVLDAGLREQPDVRAELLYTSGSILTALGDYRHAEAQLEESLEIRRIRHGELHADVVETTRALAEVRKELGELDEAEALARRSVDLARDLAGDEASILVEPLTELASVLCYRSDFESAESPALEALALTRELPELKRQEIVAIEFLAVIRSAKGQYREAATLYRQSLARTRASYGEKHPYLINSLGNLGLMLRRQEEFEAADKAYQELLDLQREIFGDDYRDPFSLANLAGLRFGQGDYPSAQELYRQALEAVLETSGPEHWMAFVFELGVEQARIRLGAPGAAERRILQLLEHWRPRLGEDHGRILQGRSVLGESLSVQGRCEEAEPLLVESYQQSLAKARHRRQRDAFERLRAHLERCGRSQEIGRYRALLTGGEAIPAP